MRIKNPRAARTAVRSLLLPTAVAALLTVAAPPAAAHTDLDGSDPANGALLVAAPATITLTFSDPMERKQAHLSVTGPDGTALGDGAPAVAGREVTLKLKPTQAAGRYTVGYRAVSADGHTVTGTSTFTIRPATPRKPLASTPRTTAPSPSPTSSLSRSAVASGERAVTSLKAVGIGFGIGLVGLIAAMTVTVRRQRRNADDSGR
ncbi:copper resistance CopC family protein [Streptomyces sp. NBC_01268]|uniref:copper resistance CopC family protein n=1 Tax=Streptomyces sp. NBC_01268 TaxID=2903806 RepID=UPI002E33FE54|nr:copper resistance CopC family protein [Streptomyces sp. NBC_01268]